MQIILTIIIVISLYSIIKSFFSIRKNRKQLEISIENSICEIGAAYIVKRDFFAYKDLDSLGMKHIPPYSNFLVLEKYVYDETAQAHDEFERIKLHKILFDNKIYYIAHSYFTAEYFEKLV